MLRWRALSPNHLTTGGGGNQVSWRFFLVRGPSRRRLAVSLLTTALEKVHFFMQGSWSCCPESRSGTTADPPIHTSAGTRMNPPTATQLECCFSCHTKEIIDDDCSGSHRNYSESQNFIGGDLH